MKLIKTNQELIVGKRYLCRTKPRLMMNGKYSTPQIEIHRVYEDGGRRYVGRNRIWAWDKLDKVISYNGHQRISAESTRLQIPFQNVEVIEDDYDTNSQALERWDIIGPIQEFKKDLLDCLFDYPEFLKCFSYPIQLLCNGDLAVQLDPDEDEWNLIQTRDDVTGIFDIDKPEETNMENIANKIPDFSEEINFKQPKQNTVVCLTETKYRNNGYLPKGTQLFLGVWSDDLNGYDLLDFAGNVIFKGVNAGFELECALDAVNINNSQYGGNSSLFGGQKGWGGLSYQYPPIHGNQTTDTFFNFMDTYLQIGIREFIRKEPKPSMGFDPRRSMITKQDKINLVNQFLQYLFNQPG